MNSKQSWDYDCIYKPTLNHNYVVIFRFFYGDNKIIATPFWLLFVSHVPHIQLP